MPKPGSRRWFCMSQRDATEIADLLEEIGRRAAFEAGNPYKAKAYVRAAANLRRLVRPLDQLIREGALQSIPGVGAAIANRIEALQHGETDTSLERLRARLPAGLLALLAIPGLRPATILKLHGLLGVSSLCLAQQKRAPPLSGALRFLGQSPRRPSRPPPPWCPPPPPPRSALGPLGPPPMLGSARPRPGLASCRGPRSIS